MQKKVRKKEADQPSKQPTWEQHRFAVKKVYILRIALLGFYTGVLTGLILAYTFFTLGTLALKEIAPYQSYIDQAGLPAINEEIGRASCRERV